MEEHASVAEAGQVLASGDRHTPAGVGKLERKPSPSDLVFCGALAFIAGIFFASTGTPSFGIVLGIASAVLLWALHIKKVPFRVVVVGILFLFSGGLYFYGYRNSVRNSERMVFGTAIEANAVVLSDPVTGERHQAFTARLEGQWRGTLMVFTPKIPEIHYGDRLALRGTIEPAVERTPTTMFFPDVAIVSSHHGHYVKEQLLTIKHTLLAQFRSTFPSDQAALAGGLTFGWRGDFSKDFKDRMARSGTTHLVALSGYNVAILVATVAALLGSFLSRRRTFIFTTLAIILFVMMVGAEGSIVRAAIMGFLVLLAHEAGRRYSVRNAITLTAALMLLVDPTLLVFDPGFTLSFLSLLGIVYLAPALTALWNRIARRRPERDASETSFLSWKENATMTLAAQLAVAPLVMSYGQGFSLTSLFANILILEFVPLTMGVGFVLALAGVALASLARIIAWFLGILLAYEIWIIDVFATVRIPVYGPSSSLLFVSVYYTLLACLVMYEMRRTTGIRSRLI